MHFSNAGHAELLAHVRRTFPSAVLLPRVSLSIYFYLWRLSRRVVALYPESWEKTSETLSAALLSGRGVVTSPHPGISRVDPECFLLYRKNRRDADAALRELFTDEGAAARAAARARRFALDRLEFSGIVDAVYMQAVDPDH